MSKVTFCIEYAGLQLRIQKNEQGQDVTPLKPISDLFGLKWETQRQKVSESTFFREYLGVCTPLMGGADDQKREQTCIRLDRVAAYLMTISPERARANGNQSGAEFLTEKLNEWADALHDYEELGFAVKKSQLGQAQLDLKKFDLALKVMRQKGSTQSAGERKLQESMLSKLASDIGLNYQPDLLDQ